MNEPQLLIEYKPVEAKEPAVPYRFMSEQLLYEINRPSVSQRQKETNELIAEKVIVPVLARAFLRSNKRKAKEPFEAYRRGLRNAKKAMKVYRQWGEKAQVLVNKNTMEII